MLLFCDSRIVIGCELGNFEYIMIIMIVSGMYNIMFMMF